MARQRLGPSEQGSGRDLQRSGFALIPDEGERALRTSRHTDATTHASSPVYSDLTIEGDRLKRACPHTGSAGNTTPLLQA